MRAPRDGDPLMGGSIAPVRADAAENRQFTGTKCIKPLNVFLHGEGAMLLKIMNLLNGHASRPSSVSVIVRNYVAKVSMY